MAKMYPMYNTMTFCQIWDNVDSFVEDYKNVGITPKIKDDSAKQLFYLLYARYGNNPIANRDLTQFKYKVFSVIFQYGPTWEKKLEIQDNLRSLSEADIMAGAKQVHNHAYNPGTDPSTSSTSELDYINDQNTSTYKKGKVEAYALLWDMLRTDVTEAFLKQFLKCFKLVVRPEEPLLYESED